MSVQKLDTTNIYASDKGYSSILNEVTQNIKNPSALSVYTYMHSLPPQWKFCKEHLMKHFGFGRTKMKRIFSYLNANKLIQYVRDRNHDGTFEKMDIVALDGQEFLIHLRQFQKPNEITISQVLSSTQSKIELVDNLSIGSNTDPEINRSGSQCAPIYNINNINNIKKQRERAPKSAQRYSLSDDFQPTEQNCPIIYHKSETVSGAQYAHSFAPSTNLNEITGTMYTRSDAQHAPDHRHNMHSTIEIEEIEKKKKRESVTRDKKPSRSSLPSDFYPNENNQKRLKEVAQKVDISEVNLLEKFKIVQRTKNKISNDWQAELMVFLINERPSTSFGYKNPFKTQNNESRSAVQFWGPGHPSYDSLHARSAYNSV